MKPTCRANGRYAPLLLIALLSCTQDEARESNAVTPRQLLDLAFEAASSLPLQPHVKNRSRAQLDVLEAALERDEEQLALRYVEDIANWRRGLGHAEIAWHAARHGERALAERQFEEGLRAADALLEEENEQAWRRDRIRARLAATALLLGKDDDAARLEEGLVASERLPLETLRVDRLASPDFEAYLASLDLVIASGDLERVRVALAACARLYERFYDDPERRERLAVRVRTRFESLPTDIRIDLLMQLAEAALGKGDVVTAKSHVDDAQRRFAGITLSAEHHVPWMARLAVLRERVGDAEAAGALLIDAHAYYDANVERIFDIDRADCLRPLAEAWARIGDRSRALDLYHEALDASVINPNGRPRVFDLVAICLSMVRLDFDPGVDLWNHITAVREGLDEPW